MRISLATVWCGVLLAAGCAHKPPDGFNTRGFTPLPTTSTSRPNVPSPQTVIVTPDTSLCGKIVKVNTGGRFVVLNFPVGHLPSLDQQFSVYHLGLKVGEVKVSGPQLDDNIIGDLVKGTAEAGDAVREP